MADMRVYPAYSHPPPYYFVGQHAGNYHIRAWFDGTKHIRSQHSLWVATEYLRSRAIHNSLMRTLTMSPAADRLIWAGMVEWEEMIFLKLLDEYSPLYCLVQEDPSHP